MSDIKKKITILGSTGSIGKSTLDVIRENINDFEVVGLSCESNLELIAQQIKEFKPLSVSVGEGKKEKLNTILKGYEGELNIFEGIKGNVELATFKDTDLVVAAVVGVAGIEPVMSAIKAKKNVALANKESIVMAGCLMTKEAKKNSVSILPIDSEHNAIFQSIAGDKIENLSYITLTASGGPFWSKPLNDFKNITKKDALNHPNWDMGDKITIDSATMMNKCLEIIEAKWIFDLKPEQIKVVIHPQSIIHSIATFKDASSVCQMGVPDMKIPISNCLGYPNRIKSGSIFLNLAEIKQLTFLEADHKKFPSLKMAYDVLEIGGGAPAALNGANEVLVDLFLKEEVKFTKIFIVLEQLVNKIKTIKKNDDFKSHPFILKIDQLSDAIKSDQWGRDFVFNLLDQSF